MTDTPTPDAPAADVTVGEYGRITRPEPDASTDTDTGAAVLGEIQSICSELGIEPGQLKGRLEASRKWEQRAKDNTAAAKELEQLRQQSMSDTEKAIDIARTEARTEVLREVGGKVVDAEVRAAVAGRDIDADALLEGLDRSRFIGEDGDPDRDAITAWVDRIAPMPTATEPSWPDLGQGARNTPPASSTDPLARDLERLAGTRRT